MTTSDASDQPIVHTPEQWVIMCDEARGRPRCLITDTAGNEIASVNPHRKSWNEDAELIAAAPELLAAAKAFIALFRDSDMRPEDECHELFSQMLTAVENATGEVV